MKTLDSSIDFRCHVSRFIIIFTIYYFTIRDLENLRITLKKFCCSSPVSLFLISISLVIFCLLVCFVD